MPSTALVQLGVRLSDIDQLMAAHGAIAGTTPGRKHRVVALNRASVLLLNAHFEGYLEGLFAETLATFDPRLDAAQLYRRFNNPWPDEIDKLFAFFGLANPSRRPNWPRTSNTMVRDALSEMVARRNRLAHGEADVSVRKLEVERWRRYVEGFAERFDEIVRAHIGQITGNSPW